MNIILAHAGNGTPMGSTGCFVGATICAIVCVCFSICAFTPTLRAKVRWGKRGKGDPMSSVSCLSWAFAAFIWGLLLFAQGNHSDAVFKKAGWLMALAIIAILGAAIYDSTRNNK